MNGRAQPSFYPLPCYQDPATQRSSAWECCGCPNVSRERSRYSAYGVRCGVICPKKAKVRITRSDAKWKIPADSGCCEVTCPKKAKGRVTRSDAKWKIPANGPAGKDDPCADITPPVSGSSCSCQVLAHKLPYGGLCEPGWTDSSSYSRYQWAADLVVCANDATFYRPSNPTSEESHPIDITSGYLDQGVIAYNNSSSGDGGSAVTNAVCAIDIEVVGDTRKKPPGVFTSHWLFDMLLRNSDAPLSDSDEIDNGVWLLYNAEPGDPPFGCGPNKCAGCQDWDPKNPCPIWAPSPSYPWPTYPTIPFLIPYPVPGDLTSSATTPAPPTYPPSLSCKFHTGLLHQLEGGRVNSTIQAVFLGDVRVSPPPQSWIDAKQQYGIMIQCRWEEEPYSSRTVITNGIAIVPLQVDDPDFSPGEPHVLLSDDLLNTLSPSGQTHVYASLVLTSQPTPSPDDEKWVWWYQVQGCEDAEQSLCVNNYGLEETGTHLH